MADFEEAEELFLSYVGRGPDHQQAEHEPTANEPLIWRLDPEESHSDWTIVVTDETDESIQTFHVHKTYLSLGSHKSEYFASLFGPTSEFKESEDNTSNISLPGIVCRALEHMLDFIYGLHNDQSFGSTLSENDLVGLRYLSKRFLIKTLFDRISELVRDRLVEKFDWVSVPMLNAADTLQDDQLVDLIFAFDWFEQTDFDIHEIQRLDQLEPRFALRFFEDTRVASAGSYWFAEAVAYYCMKNINKIDLDFFRRVTRRVTEALLPDALFLINLSRELDNGEDDQLEDLRKRCRYSLHETEHESSNWYLAAAHLTGETNIADTIVRNTQVELVSHVDAMRNYNSMASEEKVKLLERLLSFALHDYLETQNME